LASIDASPGTLISFSTQPRSVALDGDGANSPYTEALLHHIATPNLDVMLMMRDVRREVLERTNDQQVPWDATSLRDPFFFKETADAKPEPKPDGNTEVDKPSETDTVPKDKDTKPAPIAKRDETVGEGQETVDVSHLLPPDFAAPANDDAPVLTGRPPVVACDTIAASPTDPERAAPGVVIGSLDGAAGVKACRAALTKYPNTPRFEFQLARSLQVAKAYDEAAQLYAKLVKRGYLAALVNYGWLLNNGQGVRQDQKAAVSHYLLGAQQGDLLGMFKVAMA
jgi:hypothetical protein